MKKRLSVIALLAAVVTVSVISVFSSPIIQAAESVEISDVYVDYTKKLNLVCRIDKSLLKGDYGKYYVKFREVEMERVYRVTKSAVEGDYLVFRWDHIATAIGTYDAYDILTNEINVILYYDNNEIASKKFCAKSDSACDADGNGTVDSRDVKLLRSCLANADLAQVSPDFDIVKDGVTDVRDLVALKLAVKKLNKKPGTDITLPDDDFNTVS